jgi:ribulose-bisphosphate carboxylase large chain
MSETKTEVLDNIDALKTDLHGLKQVMPVASGGLHPRLVPALIETFGNDVVIQAGGGIHGHPDGTAAGAKAMRQATDAAIQKISLDEYSKTHKELEAALQTWKT